MSYKRFTETLRCTLNAEEQQAKAQELVRELNALEVLETEKAESAKDFAKRIKEQELRVKVLSFDVGSKTEERPVDCHEEPRIGELIVEIIRDDTHEVIRRRPMEPSERQRTFTFPKDNN